MIRGLGHWKEGEVLTLINLSPCPWVMHRGKGCRRKEIDIDKPEIYLDELHSLYYIRSFAVPSHDPPTKREEVGLKMKGRIMTLRGRIRTEIIGFSDIGEEVFQ